MGGSARVWGAVLPDNLVPGSQAQLRLVMTKFNPPGVQVAYEVFLESAR